MPFSLLRRHRAVFGASSDNLPADHSLRWVVWLVVLLVVLALHWVAGRWMEMNRSASNPEPAEHVPVQVELLTPKPIAQAPTPAALPPHASKPEPVKQAEPTHAITTAQTEQAAQAAQAAQAEQAAQAAAKAASDATAFQAAAAAAATGDKFSVPPSGELRYDTRINGVMNQVGNIHWINDGQRYEMVVSIPLPFVGPYVYSSKGHIDAFGIAPEQYSEQRGRCAADITVFDRTTKQLVYAKTPNNQPLADGAEDRFSVVIQLSSLVRGSPDKYKPGVVRQFSVADNDSNEIWPIETVGDENVQIADGNVQARHFTRLPRRKGDRRRLDIWLASDLGWLPVRILQTEPNGMQIEMLWRGKLQLPSATPGQSGAGTPDASEETTPAAPGSDKP
ncbi:putative PROLIN-rich signal peptide protein [Candidatus Burkholderia crenata]|nr:putative PROLIN-rich signal peptide protein [Candidatus Burkholderia crenata]